MEDVSSKRSQLFVVPYFTKSRFYNFSPIFCFNAQQHLEQSKKTKSCCWTYFFFFLSRNILAIDNFTIFFYNLWYLAWWYFYYKYPMYWNRYTNDLFFLDVFLILLMYTIGIGNIVLGKYITVNNHFSSTITIVKIFICLHSSKNLSYT